MSNITRQPDRPRYAWIENTRDAGLRFVDFADKIAPRSIKHTGWYTDGAGDLETLRGAVWRLNSGRGFIAGYVDPHNEGAAFVELRPISIDDEIGAAHAADRIAEMEAEKERDYQRAWQAGRRYEELGDDIAQARKSCLALIREARAACKVLSDFATIKDAIRDHVESYRADIRKARAKRAELFSDYGRAAAFNDA